MSGKGKTTNLAITVKAPTAPKQKVKARKRKSKKMSIRAPIKSSGVDPNTAAWIRLIADPCNSQLVHPIYGGTGNGYLSRVRYSFTVHNTSTANNGVLLWYPEYAGGDGLPSTPSTYRPGSCFVYETNNAGSPPVNSTNNPFGSAGSSVGGTYATYRDPAHNFTNSSNYASRCVAACARVLYTGPPLTKSGLFSADNNHKFSQAIDLGGATLPTIDQIASVLPVTKPLPYSAEIRWLPGSNSSVFRRTTSSNISLDNLQNDTLLYVSNTVANTPSQPGLSYAESSGIAITWRGLPTTTTGDITIELIKVFEWVPWDNTALMNVSNRPTSTVKGFAAMDYINKIADSISYVVDGYSNTMAAMTNPSVLGMISKMSKVAIGY